MKVGRTIFGRGRRLDLVAGFADGILTALVLGAGHLAPGHPPMQLGLALRVSTAAAVSGLFIFVVAHYAELRSELIEAERQLNLTEHGRLAASRLGRTVFIEAAIGALVASASTFAGALLPLVIAALVPQPPWVSIGSALAVLALFGHLLARTVYGRSPRWMVALVAGGAALAYLGMKMDIV